MIQIKGEERALSLSLSLSLSFTTISLRVPLAAASSSSPFSVFERFLPFHAGDGMGWGRDGPEMRMEDEGLVAVSVDVGGFFRDLLYFFRYP